jgi:hypothetical protein
MLLCSTLPCEITHTTASISSSMATGVPEIWELEMRTKISSPRCALAQSTVTFESAGSSSPRCVLAQSAVIFEMCKFLQSVRLTSSFSL